MSDLPKLSLMSNRSDVETILTPTSPIIRRAPLWSLKSIRLRVVILLALALTVEGLMRSNLNMAYVCMVHEDREATPRESVHHGDDCPLLTFRSNMTEGPRQQVGELLHWKSTDRAYLFPMFYIGGLFVCFGTEYIDRRIGASATILYGAIINVVCTLATPWIAIAMGPIALAAVRFIMGAGQGVLHPGMNVLVSRWFPVVEKSTALAIATTGNQLSVIFAMGVTAELCQVESLGGWPAAFYIYGILGVGLCIIWWAVVVDHPEDSKNISDDERHLLCDEVAKNGGKKKMSPVVWAICCSSFCHNFIVVGFSSYLPFYYKTVHNMTLTTNGLLCTLPFVIQFFSKVVFAGFADASKKRKWMSITAVTKICNSAASFGIALSLIVMSFCDCSSRLAAVVAASTAMAFISAYVPGYNTSVVCVAPTQTAAISSLSRLFAQVGMSLSPTLIGVVVATGHVEEWRIIFFGMAALCVSSGIFFQLCGSASVQSWNEVRESKPDGAKLLVDPSLNSVDKNNHIEMESDETK